MHRIVNAIATLQAHLEKWAHTPQDYRPKQCPHCGLAGLWGHGHYDRKADRDPGTLNPIPIPRFFCRGCRRTCSRLPSCIAPRRWYLWSVQQAVLLCLLSGISLEECATKWAHLGPAPSTMRTLRSEGRAMVGEAPSEAPSASRPRMKRPGPSPRGYASGSSRSGSQTPCADGNS